MPFLKERTFLNADRTKAVGADSSEAAYLLGTAGDEISEEDAKLYKAKVSATPPKAEAPAAAEEADGDGDEAEAGDAEADAAEAKPKAAPKK